MKSAVYCAVVCYSVYYILLLPFLLIHVGRYIFFATINRIFSRINIDIIHSNRENTFDTVWIMEMLKSSDFFDKKSISNVLLSLHDSHVIQKSSTKSGILITYSVIYKTAPSFRKYVCITI